MTIDTNRASAPPALSRNDRALNPAHYRHIDGYAILASQIERALDAGEIEAAMRNGRWWHIRRNGKTQLWKRDTHRFRIPVKAGLYAYDAMTEYSLIDWPIRG